jgi:undecaprenyl-diphosphatase
MTLLQAVILGALQGLTEFFPVSSSGHLVLAESLLGVNPPGVSFEVMVHLATVFSVIVLYRRRLIGLVSGLFRLQRDALTYVGMLLLASVPAGLVGVTLADAIGGLFDRPALAALNLLVTGCIVYATRWLLDRGDRRDPGWGGSVIVGIAQALAILPGISRSGFTVAAALWRKTGREAAAEFSFLLSIPAIVGASILQLPDMLSGAEGLHALPLSAAAISAFLTGVLAIVLFVRWLRIGQFHRFAYYCWTVGGAFILYSLFTTA